MSGTFVEFPIEDVESSIPARFEKIVRIHAERPAVTDGDRQVTYRELNALANSSARAVLAGGAGESEPVALLFDKSIEQIAAMIGVLKAGRAFVLLDTAMPKTRMGLMIKDCSATMALCDRRNASLAKQSNDPPLPVVVVGLLAGEFSTANLSLTISPQALATIFYTSGSTGQPKGILAAHATLLHAAMVRTNANRFCAADRVAHLTSGASNAINNSLIALLNGAELVLFDVKKEAPGRLVRWLSEKRITVCMIAAPLFRTLCESLTPAQRFPDLRLLRLRSDTVCKSDIVLYKKYFANHTILINGRSSSETCVLTEFYMDGESCLPNEEVPVGYAVPDKEILLLNDQGERLGDNQVGEIVVRSKYLSAGYWHDPELTAARFQPDEENPELRRYHTGDLGLRLADGCFVHKGRKDFRVKVSGYGVELGEVEKVLREHTDVRDAVALSESGASGESRLIAYIVWQAQSKGTVKDLRGWLKSKLPEYMVPSQFVFLDALPLMSNGKVDRHALPQSQGKRPLMDNRYTAPRTTTEIQLASVWGEVLSVDQVGIDDKFFDLGGHSLAASRVIARVIKAFNRDIPLQALFDAPTVAQMAEVIDRHKEKPIDNEELARLLNEAEAMSEEEAQKLLDKKN